MPEFVDDVIIGLFLQEIELVWEIVRNKRSGKDGNVGQVERLETRGHEK